MVVLAGKYMTFWNTVKKKWHWEMTKACNNMYTAAKGAVSNYSRLKWHVGCSTQNKNRKLKRLIMRRNCFINAPPLPRPLFSPLQESHILLSIAHSSIPALRSLLGGKVKRFFIYLRLKTRRTNTTPPRGPRGNCEHLAPNIWSWRSRK